jgi:hypothetical protein
VMPVTAHKVTHKTPARAGPEGRHRRWEHIAGNQACAAHILRDYQDCAEAYPDALWPVQAQRALRGLIQAWHAAREQGLEAIPAGLHRPLEHEFRHAVLAGLSNAPRVPGPKNSTRQRPGRELLEFCTTSCSAGPGDRRHRRSLRNRHPARATHRGSSGRDQVICETQG